MELYSFPFDKVSHGSKVIIYGAGEVGQTYLKQVSMTKYCDVKCMIDRDYLLYKDLPVAVYSLDELPKIEFDVIVIANNSSDVANEIINDLIKKYGISKSRVIYDNQKMKPVDVIREDGLNISDDQFAYSKKGKYAISIKLAGGFGDYLIRKENIREISLWDKNVLIDIYVTEGKEEYTRDLFSDIDNINLIVGSYFRYNRNKGRYIASFHFYTFLVVDYINRIMLDSLPPLMNSNLKKIEAEYIRYGLKDLGVTLALHYLRCRKDGYNCYTAYNRYGVFQIDNSKTTLPLSKEYEKRFEDLDLKNYITLNYGWDRNLKTVKPPAKIWPFEYYEELIILIKKKFPKINIVQIGLKDVARFDGCDSYVFGENIETVKYVLKNSFIHIDCEGGLVHMATQLGTKCAVLFGPTPVHYYGYTSNINIVSDTCSDCCWYVPDCFSCYKEMEHPQCMYSIVPNDVMERVSGELEKYTKKWMRQVSDLWRYKSELRIFIPFRKNTQKF